MTKSDNPSGMNLLNSVLAEFLKFYAFRIPQIAYASIPAFLLLFVFQLFYVERLSAHLGPVTVLEALPYLFFVSWKTIFFQLFIVAFSSYCVAVDSQYGMIRIGCTQPVSRFQYLLGKSIAIELHVILFAVVYVASLFLWVCICTGFRGLSAPTATAVVSLASRTAVFCVALSGCMVAVSVLRRSLLDALVTCCVVFACLALLTTLPMRFHLEAGLFLRYFFYPIAAVLPKDWPLPFPMQHAPLWQFVLVSFTTPAIFFIPAVLHFQFRDISE